MKKLVPVFTTLAFLSSPLFAESDLQLAAFEKAQQSFERNLAGDEGSGVEVLTQFQELVDNTPDHPLFLAYLGSGYTIKARDAWAPWTKMKSVDRGLDMIDKALNMLQPKHDEMLLRGSIVSMETRLVAISTFLKVPGFLNRTQAAKDLLQEALSDPLFEKAPPVVKGRLYLSAADAAKKDGNTGTERSLLQQAETLLPDGRFKTEVQSRLAKQ